MEENNKIINPEKIIKKIYSFFKEDKRYVWCVIICLAFFAINNLSFIFTRGIAPDALHTYGYHISDSWEVSLGRFGLVLLDLIRFGVTEKIVVMFNCAIFLSLSCVFIVKTFDIKNKIAIIIISILIAVAPQFTETYFFIYCADSYCLAMMLSTLSIYFMNKKYVTKKNKYYIFAVMCILITCSLYQAYLGVIGGLFVALIISYIIKNEEFSKIIKHVFQFLGIIIVGILSYYIVLKLILLITGTVLADYKGANTLGINTLKSLPSSIKTCYKDFFEFFFGNKIINNSPYKRKHIYLVLFIILGINIVIYEIKNNKLKDYKSNILLAVALLLFPISIAVMNLIAPNTTINLVTGPGLLATAVIYILFSERFELNNWWNIIKWISVSTLLLLTYTFILENNVTYTARQETFDNYYMVQNDIYTKATSLKGYKSNMKWIFSDSILYKTTYGWRANGFISNDNETYSTIFDNTKTQIKQFYKNYMGIDLEICSQEEYDEIMSKEEFKKMPVYPNNGSINIIDDVVVVKVKEN